MKTIAHNAFFDIPQPINVLFPLFSPEGETRWVPGWEYTNLMDSTELSEDYIFLTSHHDHKTTDAIWIVKRFEPRNHLVQFYKIEPEDKIGIVTVRCSELSPSRTRVEVKYKYIAISKTGEDFIAGFSETAYGDFIAEWKTLLLQYFKQHTL